MLALFLWDAVVIEELGVDDGKQSGRGGGGGFIWLDHTISKEEGGIEIYVNAAMESDSCGDGRID